MVYPSDHVYELQVLLQSTSIYVAAFEYARARATAERALERGHALSRNRVVVLAHHWLAWIAVSVNDADALDHHSQAMRAGAQEIGYSAFEGPGLSLRAELELLRGNEALAIERFDEAALAYEKIGDLPHTAWAIARVSSIRRQTGEFGAALRDQERALELFTQRNCTLDMLGSRLLIADLRRIAGDLESALQSVEAELDAIDEIGSLDASHSSLEARMAAWRVLDAAGDPRAAHQLELAWMELERQREKIVDPTGRTRFIEARATHRELARAWSLRESGQP
jgi:tetratricopeptide (TPR) repeat protein